MKILVVSHSYIVSENQKNITELSKHVNVQVVVPQYVDDVIQKKINAEPSPKIAIYKRLSLWGSQYFLLTWDMGMRHFAPDIVHIEYDPWSIIFWQTILYKCLYARKAFIICTVKNNTYRVYPGFRGWLKFKMARFFIRRVHHFIAINKGVENIYHSIFHVPLSRIDILQHLGVDTKTFKPRKQNSSRDKITIGYCGRFDYEKGIWDLLEAAKNCYQHNDLCVKLLGHGELKEQLLQKQYEWLDVLSPVPHKKVAEFMNDIDIFVMPSLISKDHEEHDAHALLEALACGVPSVGSDSGIITEVLENNGGLIFEAGNVNDLQEKLMWLINDELLRETLSKNAMRTVNQQFSIERIADKKVSIYRKIIYDI